ncbi:MAG: ferrous iron transport protein B [Myxococcota bacterium]
MRRVLLIGNPNAGKSSLFEALTGQCSKVANHAGVTVEEQEADCYLPSGHHIQLVDLPGLYSLKAFSDEERIALRVLQDVDSQADLILFVMDATQLRRNLFLLTELIDANQGPILVALTQMDEARRLGIDIQIELLSRRLGVPMIPVSSRTGEGISALQSAIVSPIEPLLASVASPESPKIRYAEIDALLAGIESKKVGPKWEADDLLLHPFWGLLVLAGIFGALFLTLFALGKPMADFLQSTFDVFGSELLSSLTGYPLLASLLVDGVIAGVGTLVAFVPLIALLFFLLGILEESGYLARATFLLDRPMSRAGLSGRAFVPMLSGFACAIPAIMSTRVIRSKKSRFIAMFVIPFLSCSARLPLYALLIAAFFPAWQGALVMLGLYALGVVAALLSGYFLKRFWFKIQSDELILELPGYRMPRFKHLARHVKTQVGSFLKQAGTLILSMSVLMWALFHFPLGAPIELSYAGKLGHWLEPLITPLGFDWKIGIGLLASFSAREVMVSTLGVIYGLDANWALAYSPLVAVSLLVFFALAMQCTSTLAIMRRETQTWSWPLAQFVFMTSLAWLSSFVIFQTGSALGY